MPPHSPGPRATSPRAALVVVLGAPAAAAALGRRAAAAAVVAPGHRSGRRVLLVDLTRRGALGALLPAPGAAALGLDPILAAARFAAPDAAAVRRAAEADPAGYEVVRGVGHPRAWTTMRAPAAERALDALLAAADVVVAIADDDLDGEAETGSVDLEERHALARGAVARATAVAVVVDGSPVGRALAAETAAEVALIVAGRAPEVPITRIDAAGRTIGDLVASAIRIGGRVAASSSERGGVRIEPGELGVARPPAR